MGEEMGELVSVEAVLVVCAQILSPVLSRGAAEAGSRENRLPEELGKPTTVSASIAQAGWCC